MNSTHASKSQREEEMPGKYGSDPVLEEILLRTLLCWLTGQLPANTAYLSNLPAETNSSQASQQHHSFTLESGNLWNKIKIVRIISFASQAYFSI